MGYDPICMIIMDGKPKEPSLAAGRKRGTEGKAEKQTKQIVKFQTNVRTAAVPFLDLVDDVLGVKSLIFCIRRWTLALE